MAQSLHYTIPRNRRGHATVSVHKALWDWFDNREDIEGDSDDSAALIAQLARELKGKRADADYNYDESFSDTVSSLIEAQEQIINMVMAWAKGLPDSLRNPP
ncbi:hypothetical protein EON81_05380 [bacterium]|nr:MAG: hypothetical protein EON81_05380 [bacterium]